MTVTHPTTLVSYGYASTNDLEMYYQVHGPETDNPLLLLHGGLTTIESSFSTLLPALASDRTVIAVEQQGHGRTADVDRPLSFEQMADDTAALLRSLRVDAVDVFGYSDGGNVALGLAIRHPALVRSLAIAGTNYRVHGLIPEFAEMLANGTPEDMPDEMRNEFQRVAPNPAQWPDVVRKVMRLGSTFQGWTDIELSAISRPSLVIIGDRDIIRPEHALDLYRMLPQGELAVLPGTDHGMNLEDPELLLSVLAEFHQRVDQSGETQTAV